MGMGLISAALASPQNQPAEKSSTLRIRRMMD
jgi:hypothetical protein